VDIIHVTLRRVYVRSRVYSVLGSLPQRLKLPFCRMIMLVQQFVLAVHVSLYRFGGGAEYLQLFDLDFE